jgi:hypothetical protein
MHLLVIRIGHFQLAVLFICGVMQALQLSATQNGHLVDAMACIHCWDAQGQDIIYYTGSTMVDPTQGSTHLIGLGVAACGSGNGVWLQPLQCELFQCAVVALLL